MNGFLPSNSLLQCSKGASGQEAAEGLCHTLSCSCSLAQPHRQGPEGRTAAEPHCCSHTAQELVGPVDAAPDLQNTQGHPNTHSKPWPDSQSAPTPQLSSRPLKSQARLHSSGSFHKKSTPRTHRGSPGKMQKPQIPEGKSSH